MIGKYCPFICLFYFCYLLVYCFTGVMYKHNEAWQSFLCYCLTIIIIKFFDRKDMEQNKKVYLACMMYKIIIINDLMYVKMN